MKSFIAVLALAALATADAATCATSTLSALLSNPNIDACASGSGYAFTSGVKPTEAEAKAMCATDACHSLLEDAQGMNLSECEIPLGDKINLLADLINYVPTFCTDKPDAPTDGPSPTTAAPGPTSAPGPNPDTPATTKPAAC